MKVNCKVCGFEFNRKPSMIKNNIYCSLKCRDSKSYKNNFIDDLTEKDYLEQNYIINSDGSIINRRTNKEVKFSINHKGYYKARLHTPLSKNPDGRKPYFQHRVIAMFYLDDYSNELQVNHKNGIKTDNRVENLEMMTCGENIQHSWTELSRELKINRDEYGKFISK
jgi:hypothetical protein